MIGALADFLLWDGVAMVAISGIAALGLCLGPKMILVAGCIPVANLVILVGHYFHWWEYTGFMGLLPTILVMAIIVVFAMPWVLADD